MNDHVDFHDPVRPTNHTSSRALWALAGFAAIALFFLLSEHRAHFLGALPWLLLLACPLLHFFGHGGHGHGHGGMKAQDDRRQGGGV